MNWRLTPALMVTGTALALVLVIAAATRGRPRHAASAPARVPAESATDDAAPNAPDNLPAAALLAPSSAPDAIRARPAEVIGSTWTTETQPAHAMFRAWTERYRAAAPDARRSLEREGVALARARRDLLEATIAEDPRRVLTLAIPRSVAQELPTAVTNLLEEPVSGIGSLALLLGRTPDGHPVRFHSALLGEREYRAHVFGRRTTVGSLEKTSIVGVALGRELAVSEQVFQLVESGARLQRVGDAIPGATEIHEGVGRTPPPTAAWVNFDGADHAACCEAHLDALETRLLALEKPNTTAALTAGGPGSSDVIGRPTPAWTLGPKRVLMIRVDFSDLPGGPSSTAGPLDADYIDGQFNDPQGVADFFAENSYGKSSIVLTPATNGVSPDVTPVLRVPETSVSYATQGDAYLLKKHAEAAATAAGYDLPQYDRVGICFASLLTVPGGKFSWLGMGELAGRGFWLNGALAFKVVTHELGHTFGLMHGNRWTVADGDPLSPAGTDTEYGDVFDMMGSGGGFEHHFSHRAKSILHWLPDSNITTATADGLYRIHRLDSPDADLALPRAVKVARSGDREYWLGYRRATNNATYDHGVYVVSCRRNLNDAPKVLDLTTPGASDNDHGLTFGGLLSDPASEVEILPLDQGGSGADEWIEVYVDFAPFRSKLQWGRAQWYFDETGGRAEISVTRQGSSIGAASATYTTTAGTAGSPSNFSARTGIVSWADGDVSEKKVTILLSPDALAEGYEDFQVSLAAPAGAMLGGRSTTTVSIADAGRRDPTFNAVYSSLRAHCLLALPDGSWLLGGHFVNSLASSSSALYRQGIARLTDSGNLRYDGFGSMPGSLVADGPNGTAGAVYALVRQADGAVVAAGDFVQCEGLPRRRLVRFTASGALDPTFNPGTGPDGVVRAVAVQPDGKIVIGGDFVTYRGVARRHLARLQPDGSLDESFLGPAFAPATDSRVNALARLPDGKILVGGRFSSATGPSRSGLCRIDPSGALDPAFMATGDGAHTTGAPSAFRAVLALALQPDGRILVGGDFSAFHGQPRGGLARLEQDGTLDHGFAPASNGACHALFVQADGRILVGGAFTQFNGQARKNLVRISSSGALDATYTSDHNGIVRAFAALAEDRVLFAGEASGFQGLAIPRVAWSVFASPRRAAAILAPPRHRAVRLGAPAVFSVNAEGAEPLAYQWYRDGATLAGANGPTLTVAAATFSDAGSYSVAITNPFGTTHSPIATLDVRPQALRLTGIATRAQVGTGSDIQIGGFAISGLAPKRVVLRATGPTLATYGVAGALADPVLSLYSGTTLLGQNDNWSAADAAEFTRLGMADWAVGSRDAAFIVTLAPGSYTAQVAGKDGGTGIALLEIYDADDRASFGQLTGISTRALVGSASSLLVGGFAIESDVPKRVIVRASGPALAAYGVGGSLSDPVLTIFEGQTAIATSDDWDPALAPDFAAVGLFEWPAGSKDAALSLTLPPGAYTAQVSGKNGATGVALIEIYED